METYPIEKGKPKCRINTMRTKIISIYKIPLLLSLTLTIVLLALKLQANALAFAYIILGGFAGTFLLDLDYIVYAYFLEPTADFSKTIKGFWSHCDPANALAFSHFNKHNIEEKTLNSVLFQIVLGAAAILVCISSANLLAKAFLLSAFVNSAYRLSEFYFDDKTSDWFWMLKAKPDKKALGLYVAGLVAVLIFSLRFF